MPRLYLSPPHMTGEEAGRVREVFDSNWIAPLGPEVDAFEREFAQAVGAGHAAALNSGTAALHLGLVVMGVGAGDEVLVSDLTFAASAFPVLYVGAKPTFVDSERTSWNMDPALLAEELETRARTNRLPRAVVLVHLYGQTADLDEVARLCAEHGVILIEDAAEALGATYRGRAPGTTGAIGAFSFNGNKMITTSGGGMLVSDDARRVERVRRLAAQAREPVAHYEHRETGYNYRLSNILGSIGRVQLRALPERVAARRAIAAAYDAALGSVEGLSFMPEAPWGLHARWLTVLVIDRERFGAGPGEVLAALERRNIEARPVWMPMHMQPVFRECRVVGGGVGEEVFRTGLCLPSGSAMTPSDVDRVVAGILSARG